jgi:hypothetical protein
MKLAAEREVTVYPIIHSFPQSQHFREMAKNNRIKLKTSASIFSLTLMPKTSFSIWYLATADASFSRQAMLT